jgi:predicted aminopeptidase
MDRIPVIKGGMKITKNIKKTNRFLAFRMACLALCIIPLSGCYLLKQGCYVMKYSAEAKRIDTLLQRADTPEDLKAFFLLVDEVRRFSSDSIGLVENDNYSTYVNVDKKHIVDVVYGAEKLGFIPYRWSFPFLGSFPNKGFFELEDAHKEAKRLAEKGYDTCVLGAPAFSMLGFSSDPLYSYMKRYSVFGLANLIFHEQTHATLFVSSHLQFNEELATFIGQEGALRFVRGKFGDTSEQYRSAVNSIRADEVYNDLIKSLCADLKAVYESAGLTDDAKLRLKQAIITHFKDFVTMHCDSLFPSRDKKRPCDLSKVTINNASLVADMTYTLNLSLFRELYERKHHDFRAMLASLKTLKKKKGDLHEWIGTLE